jgi:DNA recombination protein RmuC
MEAALVGSAIAILVLGIICFRTSRTLRIEREGRVSSNAKLAHLEGCEAALANERAEVVRLVQVTGELEAKSARLPNLECEIENLTARLVQATTDATRLETILIEKEVAHAKETEALTAIRTDIDKNLKVLTADSLKDNQESFLRLANEVFQKHKEGAAVELGERQKEFGALLEPIATMLNAYQEKIVSIENTQHQAYGAFTAELKYVAETQNGVRAETAKLVNALRAAPKTRGRWGEHTLRNVIELSGLSSHCDFTPEKMLSNETGTLRPDLIIHLPGGRSLVVDAKTSLSAYLDAVECSDDTERERLLTQHVSQMRNHVKQLAAKSYWETLTATPDFVVMFVPGDNFYTAAAERDPTLFEDAAARQVLIVTPATLIALAKAVAYGWRQEKVAENSKAVHALGRDLYKRLSTMGAHIGGLGRKLGDSVKHYNDFVGSLESSVMPQARKFNEWEVEGTSSPVETLPLIEHEVRTLMPNRDILLSGPAAVESTAN